MDASVDVCVPAVVEKLTFENRPGGVLSCVLFIWCVVKVPR